MSTGIPPNIAQLTGPLFLGHIFNWGLFGVLVVQTYIYYLSFPIDPIPTKAIVVTVFIVEVLQTVLTMKDGFREFGSGWGSMEELDTIGLLWFSVPVLSGLISTITQIFYAWRVWILSKRLWIPIIITLVSLVQMVAAIWTGVYARQLRHFSQLQSHTFRQTSTWLGGTALCDVIIAASMIYYLSTSRTGFRSTNVLISKVLRLTVETGLLCATFAILDLVLFLVYRNNNYHLAPSVALSKLYSNSILALLNTRMRKNSGLGAETTFGVSYHGSTDDSTITFKHPSTSNAGQGVINVSVVKEGHTDALELNAYKKDSPQAGVYRTPSRNDGKI